MHNFRIGFIAIVMLAGASASHAGTTEWMSESQLESYANTKMVGKIYATAISCKDSKDGPLLRFDYAAFPKGYVRLTGIDLFYRWNWLVTKSSDLSGAVSKTKRGKEKRHLKWRVVQQSSYVDASGVKMTCAVLYR
ncbi:MAG: hypothetical protein Q7T14_02685 [Aestuariivirga sp.]|nr:hypothetical protein [Aestuariivirga sp.]